jgi:glycosyltransferase involved in cell wall biosynthesis
MTPLILSAWGNDINAHFEMGSDPTARAFVAEALSGASLTIVDAPGMKTRCEMLAGRPVPAEMLHLGVDTNHFRAGLQSERLSLRSQLGVAEDDILFSSMRALNATYNQDLILEAFVRSVAKLKQKAYLLFKTYNADPDYLQMLQQKTREYGVTDRIRFVDEMPYSAMPSLYAATDVVINFPQRDSLPVTFLEAAACQREVISNKLEIYSGVMSDENITWFPANDHLALADAITERAKGYRYGEERFPQIRELVIAEFSELKYQNRIRSIYRELAGLG